MHDQGIIHGNLRGVRSNFSTTLPHPHSLSSKANVLIDNDGHARLSDFGLLTIISDEPTITSTAIGATMAYWMSPELLDPERFGLVESHPTNESDCYALGMMIYGVLGGRAPFDKYSSLTVVRKVLEGERPEKPQGTQGVRFTDSIWGMLELCWKHQPCDRIGAKAVLWYLEGNQPPLEPSSTVGGVETGVDDQSDATSGDPQYVPSVSTQTHL